MLGFTSSLSLKFGGSWASTPQHHWNHYSQSYPSTFLEHRNTPGSTFLSKMFFSLVSSDTILYSHPCPQSLHCSILLVFILLIHSFILTQVYLFYFLLIFKQKKRKTAFRMLWNPEKLYPKFCICMCVYISRTKNIYWVLKVFLKWNSTLLLA